MEYKCKSCSNKVSENTIRCPHCGDADAVYNKEIEKNLRIIIATKKAINVVAVIVGAMPLLLYISIYIYRDITRGLFDDYYPLRVGFILLLMVLGFAIWLVGLWIQDAVFGKSNYYEELSQPRKKKDDLRVW